VSRNRPTLRILPADGDKAVPIPTPPGASAGEASWSPDGRRVAFVALVGGLMDLYIYDLQGGALKRVTNDAFAELQPAWSPDGRRIAFVTDRFTTKLESLATGPYRLAPLPRSSRRSSMAPSW
jgi:Tol biopolymer transport system component